MAGLTSCFIVYSITISKITDNLSLIIYALKNKHIFSSYLEFCSVPYSVLVVWFVG